LFVLLTWITIEDLARFDMALLNHMDRSAHLSLLRDTEHGGVLSVSGREDGYKFDSGVAEWLETRHVFMRALKFEDSQREIPAGFLARIGRQLLRINLDGCTLISDAEMDKLAARCPRLQNVCLRSCSKITDATAASIATHCQGISVLDLSYTRVTDIGLGVIGGKCRGLEEIVLSDLNITDVGVGKIAESGSNLECVDLHGCSAVTDISMTSLAQCPKLRTLRVGLTQLTDAGLARLVEGCRALETLNVGGTGLTDTGLRTIAQGCPQLIHLVITGGITDAGLAAIAQNCTMLGMLGIGNTQITAKGLARLGERCRAVKRILLFEGDENHMSDAGLHMIALSCPGLVTVGLFNCCDITITGALSLAECCTQLHTLHIRGTQITDEGVDRLEEAYPDLCVFDL
jgi:hypothetical protein